MDEIIEPRLCSGAFNLPEDNEKAAGLVSNLLRPYSFAMVMGLSCTGKTALLRLYKPLPNWTVTRWDRDVIMNMIFPDGFRDDKYYSYINSLESDVLPELSLRDQHQTLVKGWNRTAPGRRRYLSYAKVGKRACIVMDGPTEELVKRAKAKNVFPRMTDAEVELFIEQKHASTVWPNFGEGWTDIFYVNTFGKDGVDYLNERLIIR